MHFDDGKIWEPLKIRDLHFCHLNVNSLLSKTDKLRDITNYIRPKILGITEWKLDSSVTNAGVNTNGYSIIRNVKSRNVEMLHVTLETMCVLISRIFFSNSIEHDFFFEIVILKVKPTAIRIFHRPLNANDFSNTFLNDFQQFDKKN